MAILHKIFPKIIYESFYYDSDNFRQIVIDTIHTYCDTNGQTGEHTGNVNIHLDSNYVPFFNFVAGCVKDYVKTVNEISSDNFNYHLVKSWFNASTSEDNPKHDHSDAHISFVYYCNTPTQFEKQIVFHNDFNSGLSSLDLFSGMQILNSPNKDYNRYSFPTKQGKIYIFSSKVPHSVENLYSYDINKFLPIMCPADAEKNRISLAGDFILTYKHKSPKHLGLQPVSNWITF